MNEAQEEPAQFRKVSLAYINLGHKNQYNG